MYEYTPNYTRKKEFLTLAALTLSAVLVLAASRQKGTPFPAIWQLVAFVLLTAVVFVTVRYLLRRYTYRIAPREDGFDGSLDLTVIEQVGKKREVVCRVSLSDIEEAVSVTPKNAKQMKAARRGHVAWSYYAEMSPTDLCQLTVRDGETVFLVLLQADEKLLSFFQKR